MGSFVHTADGVIVIDKEYRFSLGFFKKLEPDYSLPEGAISQRYIQGKQYMLSNGNTQIAKDATWGEGDRYISRLSELLYLEQHDIIREEERQEYIKRLKNSAK